MQITKQNWLDVWQAVKITAASSPTEVLCLSTPQISTINAGTGTTENGIMVFEVLILGLLDFFGVKWEPVQIRETAELLFDEYYWLHIAELKHFGNKAKLGHFNQIFNKLSPKELTAWMLEYSTESLHARESQDYLKKLPVADNAPLENAVDPEMVFSAIAQFGDMLKKDIEQDQAEKPAEPIQTTDPAAYARLMNVNFPEVAKQFKPEPKNKAS